MGKNKYKILLFIMNAIAMSLELVASRILAPYFGNTNMVWTSVIGIILFSTSIGNYFGGRISDKKEFKEDFKNILRLDMLFISIFILLIPFINEKILQSIVYSITNEKIGAIIGTIILFLIPNIFIGILSPLILKYELIKNEKEDNIGKISGNIYAIGTLGSIVGTFASGFWLVPFFGAKNILFVLTIICLLVMLLIIEKNDRKKETLFYILFIAILIVLLAIYIYKDNSASQKVLNGDVDAVLSLDTEYGTVKIYNDHNFLGYIRVLEIDGGAETISYYDEEHKYDVIKDSYYDYFQRTIRNNDKINNTLLIGGAGYVFPRYYISHFADKTLDVVEIDNKITEIAKKYFFLDDLIKDYDLNNNKRLNIIHDDGRLYVNNNVDKKYDLILNDAFIGRNPVKTLCTLEFFQNVERSLTDDGIYAINIISSLEGKGSRLLRAEVNTLKKVFKNVVCVKLIQNDDDSFVDNILVIASNGEFNIPDGGTVYDLKLDENEIILTDDYCPVEIIGDNH